MNAATCPQRRLVALVFLTLLWVIASLPGLAQSFDARHGQAAAANPPGVTFTIRLADGKTKYHMGERIPVEAVFTGSQPGAYYLNTDPGNRNTFSIFWTQDVFVTDRPRDAVDPLRAYYDPQPGVMYSGGPRRYPLTATPIAIPLDVNEWLRFDKPGTYHIYLTCARLKASDTNEPVRLFVGLPTASNVLQIQILPPDPAWSAQTLAEALPAFNTTAHDYRGVTARKADARTIRFLDTPEAAQAIINSYATLPAVDGLIDPAYYDYQLGLLGSPNRHLIIRQMQDKIAAPNFPIGVYFLADLAELETLNTYPNANPNPLPTSFVGMAHWNWSQWQREAEQRDRTWAVFFRESESRLQQALPAKRGLARVCSLYFLFRSTSMTPARQQTLATSLVADFDELTPDEQKRLLLNVDWPIICRPAMLPHLRRLWAGVVHPENQDFAFNDLVLRRLYELSPQEGRQLILQEAAKPYPHVDMDALGSLPDATLPQLDDTWAGHLDNSKQGADWDTTGGLIARYATSAILPRIKAIYGDKGGKWACRIQSALLAYFLRTDPTYGAVEVKKALASRHDTDCYRTLLSDVGTLYWCPELKQIATDALHDPDPDVAADAAKALGAQGKDVKQN